MHIRPVSPDDHRAVLELAKAAGFGMTSLPADEEVLAAKIEASVKSFAGDAAYKGKERFLFVLANSAEDGRVVGTTGIKTHVGLNQPFYSYKLSTITQQSRELDLFSKHQLLNVTNDLTECSEIGSLFLLPEFRRDRLGRALSLSRFLFMACFVDFFAEQTIAELRGVHDPEGNAPFYDSIARHFFEMEFAKADYLNATRGNQFINDLMPRYPIYTSLLPKAAKDVIGQPHPNSVPARAMLEKEGFKWMGYVDIFDGGPTLQAETRRIRTLEQSVAARISQISETAIEAPKSLICNTKFGGFRACTGRIKPLHADGSEVVISARAAHLLGVTLGDTVRFAEY